MSLYLLLTPVNIKMILILPLLILSNMEYNNLPIEIIYLSK